MNFSEQVNLMVNEFGKVLEIFSEQVNLMVNRD